jgi:hypothetical protein
LQSQPHATPPADQRSCANQDIEAAAVDDTDGMRRISTKIQKTHEAFSRKCPVQPACPVGSRAPEPHKSP